jgi:DNA repair protein SbcD/Mre11
MKIIHTADWHLGNTIYEYDRSYEHKCFFNNLKSIIEKESVDALLVCGDIFHNYMPSNVAENIFGEFLVEFRKTFPKLQIVIIAGNHDGGLKIDTTGKYCSLDPRIHIIGTIPYKTDSDQIDYEKMTIPLFDQNDAICAYVLAIPYIRPSYLHGKDLFKDGLIGHGTLDCVSAIYSQAFDYIKEINKNSLPVIAMGHATVQGVSKSQDNYHLLEIGGEESIPSAIFDEAQYAALGHIHLHQNIGKSVHYCGSPIPINVGEADYKNGLQLLNIIDGQINYDFINLPRAVDMIRIPKGKGSVTLDEALAQVAELNYPQTESYKRPFVSFVLSLENSKIMHEDRITIKEKIDAALDKKVYRLGSIKIDTISSKSNVQENNNAESLDEIPVTEVFKRCYFQKHPDAKEIDPEVMNTFMEIFTICKQEKQVRELADAEALKLAELNNQVEEELE